MPCTDNIVTLGICPDDAPSTSGFSLLQAPGISIKNLNNIANENDITGVDLALKKKALSITQVQNDLIAALNTNNVAAKIGERTYDTGSYNPANNLGTFPGERGITLHRNYNIRGKLRKLLINTISIYPFTSGNFSLKLYDTLNGVWSYTEFPLTLVANQVNTFKLGYTVQGTYCRLLIDGTNLQVASTKLVQCLACSGSLPNECGHVEGWNGAKVKGEGFGISINFNCFCDWSELMCELNKTYIGELIWLKWQYNILQEQYSSNRFSDWVIYSHDELPDQMNELAAQYNATWSAMMDGLFSILNNFRDDCLDCRGVRWRTNT